MSTPKISSYQKMKQRYEAKISTLQNDIMTLVEDKDFTKVTIVKTKYRMYRDQENTAWFGNPSLNSNGN
jgi:hypothetical protein